MSDKELLELAAKAAGYHDAKYQDMRGWGEIRHGLSEAMSSDIHYDETGTTYWNPLTDDGDALRLAVKLGVWVDTVEYEKGIEVFCAPNIRICQPHGDDPYAATRRAIVRAAAEIGRTK